MAIPEALRNQHTRLETGKAPDTRVCQRCQINATTGRNLTCGPCQVDAHDRRQEAARGRARAWKQGQPRKPRPVKIEPESVHMLGRAARRAGLTVADLNAMDPPLTPEDERLLSHG